MKCVVSAGPGGTSTTIPGVIRALVRLVAGDRRSRSGAPQLSHSPAPAFGSSDCTIIWPMRVVVGREASEP